MTYIESRSSIPEINAEATWKIGTKWKVGVTEKPGQRGNRVCMGSRGNIIEKLRGSYFFFSLHYPPPPPPPPPPILFDF